MFLKARKSSFVFSLAAMSLGTFMGCSAQLDSTENEGNGNPSNPITPDGGMDSEDFETFDFGAGLECNTYSLCSSYNRNLELATMPSTLGGAVLNGLYRPVAGTDQHIGLAIHNGKYSLIFENLSVSHGDISFQGTTMTQTRTNICSNDTFIDADEQPEFKEILLSDYAVAGDSLFTRSVCDAINPDACSTPTQWKLVRSLCQDLGQFECRDGTCECQEFSQGTIPARPEGNQTCDDV